MKEQLGTAPYFPFHIPIASTQWHSLELGSIAKLVTDRGIPRIIFYRQIAMKLNNEKLAGQNPVHAAQLNLFATLQNIFRYLIDVVAEEQEPAVLLEALRRSNIKPDDSEVKQTVTAFVDHFPPEPVLLGHKKTQTWLQPTESSPARRKHTALRELLLLRMAAQNPAVDDFRQLLDDRSFSKICPVYPSLIDAMNSSLARGPVLNTIDMTLFDALYAPIKASPNSLAGQISFIQEQWHTVLPQDLLEDVVSAFDILVEEERQRGWGGDPGPPPVLEFGRNKSHHSSDSASDGSSVFGGYDYPEYEGFSRDIDWMPNVVLMAKMVYVWLTQLTQQHGHPISRLDQIPDVELDRLSKAGFTGLWLIGVWERSPASQRIKQICGNPEAIASAYSLYDYEIAEDLGGWEALANLRERALKRGIRLASDMVPNHTGIYSRWVMQHPDWFVQTDYPPFPTYQFTGENLSHSEHAVIQIEDGYWTKSDASVVFRYIESQTGRIRYIYHGNDGTSIPWNDTAQLNYLLPEVREAVIQTILHVARNFPIIRFDAAMTLAKKHYERLWFPLRGLGGGIPSRAEHGMTREEFDSVFPEEFWRNVVDRVAVEAPGTLLLAEAFWMMEGYFVRTLGMHRVYNSAFMNMLKKEENAKYRQTITNVLEFNPEILKRFVNFMNNPDEKTAVEQFGTEGKYFGACMMMATMPGLPMFGHGQIEGLREKYGMEYKRAYWDESVDEGLVRGHEMWIFPLLRRRWLFSGSENFALFNFYAGTTVNENVFAYSNRVDDHRALVLYNNSYSTTAGWIRESAAFAAKPEAEAAELIRIPLSSALKLNVAENIYYSFHDIVTNRFFLRQSTELYEKGLYVELGEYEFHVFMDFMEIEDDTANSWSNLCKSLSGRGVENIEEERLLKQFDSLNTAYRSLLELIDQSTVGSLSQLTPDSGFYTAIKIFSQQLQSYAPKPSKPVPNNGHNIRLVFEMLDLLYKLKPSTGTANSLKSRLLVFLNTSTGVRLIATWALLRNNVSDIITCYGLFSTLRRLISADLPADQAAIANSSIQLLQSLLAFSDFPTKSTLSIAEKAFEIPACRDFMLLHDCDGINWFNKERFDELLIWLYFIDLATASKTKLTIRTISSWLKTAAAEFCRIQEMAAHAGYRSKLFLSLIEPSAVSATIVKQKKLTLKVNDVKGTARPNKSKTQDDKIPG